MATWRTRRALVVARLGFWLYLPLATLALVSGLEGVGRLYLHWRYGRPGKTYGLWIADPELGATHRPHGYNTHTSLNDQGFRNREDVFEPKPAGALRVVAFGGSTTFGYNLADGETYTERLEARLRRWPGRARSQVLNAGRITYSAGQNLTLVRRLAPRLRPDYALLYEGVNELFNAWMLAKDGVALDSLGTRVGVIGRSYDYNRWLLRNSLLVRFIDYVVKARLQSAPAAVAAPGELTPSARPSQPIHPWVLRNYEALLRAQIRALRAASVEVVVFRPPASHRRAPEQRTFADLSARVALEERVTVCDLLGQFDALGAPSEDLFIETGVHVTARGAEFMAAAVEATLRTLDATRGGLTGAPEGAAASPTR